MNGNMMKRLDRLQKNQPTNPYEHLSEAELDAQIAELKRKLPDEDYQIMLTMSDRGCLEYLRAEINGKNGDY